VRAQLVSKLLGKGGLFEVAKRIGIVGAEAITAFSSVSDGNSSKWRIEEARNLEARSGEMKWFLRIEGETPR